MDDTLRRTSFCDDLRKTFLKHALIPLTVAVLMVLLVMGVSLISNVVSTCYEDATIVREQVNQIWEECSSWLEDFSVMIDMTRFSSQLDYRADVYTEVYRFINTFDIPPQLYLMDDQYAILFSTEKNASVKETCHSLLYWRLIRNLQINNTDTAALLARSVDTEAETNAYWLMGYRLRDHAGMTIGYACFVLPRSIVANISNTLTSHTIITDAFDRIYLSTMPTCRVCLGKLTIPLRGAKGVVQYAGMPYYIHQESLAIPGATLYTVQNCAGIVTMLSLVIVLALIMFLAIFVAAFFSLRRSLNRKTKIFEEITNACQLVQVGNLTTRLHADQYTEFAVISDSYNQMLDSIQRLMEESVELAKETAVSRIKQLESQFNPHFLFNTLETVRYMVRMNPEAANAMILNMATLLRYSIDTTNDVITLEQDMAFTHCYISIMKQRFGQRLQYELTLPDELRNARITKLIAQPIIENCLKHCMDKKESLVVSVVVQREGEDLTLAVRDNGPGISKEVLDMLHDHIHNPAKRIRGHIGLLNVHERLRLMYGDKYGLEIASSEQGTEIMLRFPYQEYTTLTLDGGE